MTIKRIKKLVGNIFHHIDQVVFTDTLTNTETDSSTITARRWVSCLGDPEVLAAIAKVTNSAPSDADYGLVMRPILPLTAFGDLRIAELSPIFQVSFEFTVTNIEIGTIAIAGSGAVTQAEAMCVVNTGATTASTAEWETVNNSKYRPGLGGVARFTALFTAGVAGTEQSVGLEDTDGSGETHLNGYAVGYNGTVFSFLRWQNDVLFDIAQSSWDDPMDGSGASGMTLDPTKLNVYFIQFKYLGAGAIKLWIENKDTGVMVLAHTILYARLILVCFNWNTC